MSVERQQPTVMQLVLSLEPGGTERLVIEIVKRLSEQFRMLVCCLDQQGDWAGELIDRGVPVVALHRRAGFRPSLGLQVARLAAAHNTSIVHCHHYSPFVYGRIASLMTRVGVVFTEHGRLSDAPPTLKRRLANRLFRQASAPVFAVSEALKQHVVAEGFTRVGVIYNGIDPGEPPGTVERAEVRRELDLADDDFVIGTTARLDPVKDLPTLVAAVAQMRSQSGRGTLVIVGDGPDRSVIEQSIRDHALAPHVRLTGYRQDARRLMAAFDVYANSSISEGVSLTILEAMAAVLPVAATGVGGTPEVVLDDVTGTLVAARNAGSMAAALASLADPERRRRLGEAGRRRVESAFSIDRMVQDYAREYTRLGVH